MCKLCFKVVNQITETTMKTLIILVLNIIFLIPTLGQETPDKFRIYKTKIRLLNEKKTVNGTLYTLNDSTIILLSTSNKDSIRYGDYKLLTTRISNIKVIKTRRKGRTGKSAAIGLGVGVAFGGILGYSTGDWNSEPAGHPDSQAYFGATLFGLPCAAIGLIVGSLSNQYWIYGDLDKFATHRKKLNKFAIVKENEIFNPVE